MAELRALRNSGTTRCFVCDFPLELDGSCDYCKLAAEARVLRERIAELERPWWRRALALKGKQ